jgi:SNF2 family DNA or RNA helicase
LKDKSLLSPDQVKLVNRLYEQDETLVSAVMGFGKSVCTLTAISELIRDGHLKRVLIVAPLKPCKLVWATEHLGWSHLSHLRVGLAVGSPAKREQVIESDVDIVVINFDNLAWYCEIYKDSHGFDGLVIDELTKLKDSRTKAAKRLRYRVNGYEWRIGLTGSIVAESFTGLFSQVLCLDAGKRLGKSKERFLQKYFYPTDWEQRNWELRPGMEKVLLNDFDDLLYVTNDYRHLLPELVERQLTFPLAPDIMDDYNDFKKHSVTLDDMVVADNAAVLSGKLCQYASGFLYGDEVEGEKRVHELHESRLYALDEYLNMDENTDQNILIFYYYQADKQRLLTYFDGDAVLFDDKVEQSWNKGDIKYLLAHPLNASHGLNLASGGCRVLWYTPQWSNDVFTQANARLHRRGQLNEVIVTTLVAEGTINELAVQRVSDKADYDALFQAHVKG